MRSIVAGIGVVGLAGGVLFACSATHDEGDGRAASASFAALAKPSSRSLVRSPGAIVAADDARGSARIPLTADAPASLRDEASGLSARFALEGAAPTPASIDGRLAVFPRALGPASVAWRAVGHGVEDLVAFPAAPETLRLAYRLELGAGVAGLRLVDRSLELLDAGGAPRIHMEAPYVVGAEGRRTSAEVSIEGCEVDRDPAPPWGRPVVAPGSGTCEVIVGWGEGVVYPAVVDPAWSPSKTSLSVARFGMNAAVLADGRALVAGGMIDDLNGVVSAASDLYDPTTDTWAATGSLPEAVFSAPLVVIPDGRAVAVGGGLGGGPVSKTTALFDPKTGTWSKVADLPTPRIGHGATLLADGRVIVAGGCVTDAGGNCTTFPQETAIYDPKTDAWSTGPTLLAPRFGSIVTTLGTGEVLVGVGDQSGNGESAETIDPGLTKSTATKPPTYARQRPAWAVLPDGRVIAVAGGDEFGNAQATVEVYDPNSRDWGEAPMLTDPRTFLAMFLLPSGTLAVASGDLPNGDLSTTTETTTTALGAWTILSGPGTLRDLAAYATLPSGVGVLAGGRDVSYNPIAEVDVIAEPCTADSQCPNGLCVNGLCKGKKSVGDGCGKSTECATGFCVDGVCCDGVCSGQCEACDVSGKKGTCTPTAGPPHGTRSPCTATDPACAGTCDGTNAAACAYPGPTTDCSSGCVGSTLMAGTCNGSGTCHATAKDCAPYACGATSCKTSCTSSADCSSGFCTTAGTCQGKKPIASPCSNSAECASGFCADGVCCDTACSGQCQACDVASSVGTCTLVNGAPHGTRSPCHAKDASCAGSCDGQHADACAYPASDTTCAASCSGAVETSGTCDGNGACAVQTKPCGGYACGPTSCNTACAVDADCADGYQCSQGSCIPRPGPTCLPDGHTLKLPDGTYESCTPYTCTAAGMCRTTCDDSTQCSNGTTCSASRACVPPGSAVAPDASGCGCSVPRGGGRGGLAIALFAGLFAAARRRRTCRGSDASAGRSAG